MNNAQLVIDEVKKAVKGKDDVTKIVAATDGNLWITTYWRGVDYFDKKAGNV